MHKLLIIEDDEAMRKLIRERLKDSYEIVETGDATDALALALEHKPDCILLDLMMPRFSGLELCQTFASVSHTEQIPVLVITGQSAAEHKDCCLNLGARDFFEKPIDFARLKHQLASIMNGPPRERRSQVRIRLKVVLKLAGLEPDGKEFEVLAATDEVSLSGFLCRCNLPTADDGTVDVFLLGRGRERHVGPARLVHVQWHDLPWQTCGFEFIEKTGQWIL